MLDGRSFSAVPGPSLPGWVYEPCREETAGITQTSLLLESSQFSPFRIIEGAEHNGTASMNVVAEVHFRTSG